MKRPRNRGDGLSTESWELHDLVIRDEEGRPFTVRYHILPTLLLAEIQRLEREWASQADAIAAQARAIDELRNELRVLRNEQR